MKILSLDFHDDGQDSAWHGYFTPSTGYRFSEGLRALGHEVIKFDPRKDEWSGDFRAVDLVWIAGQMIRHCGNRVALKAMRGRPVIINYCDARTRPPRWLTPEVARHTDLLCHGAGGYWLERCVEQWGFARAAFLPGPVLDYGPSPYEGDRDIAWFFSGTTYGAGDGLRGQDLHVLRREVGRKLIAPGWNMERAGGMRHVEFCHRARRAIAVSHFNAWHKYTSQRLWNYMSCGIDVAVRDFPGADELLPDFAVRYDGAKELRRIAAEERDDRRAVRLRRFALANYSAEIVAGAALGYLEGEEPDVRWAEMIERASE